MDSSLQKRMIAESAALNFRELGTTCDVGADGTVLDTCELIAMRQGCVDPRVD